MFNISMAMKLIIIIAFFILVTSGFCSGLINEKSKCMSKYNVAKLEKPMKINGLWHKPEWQNCEVLYLNYSMVQKSKYQPFVSAKMKYDSNNIYVIFRVEDCFVRCVTNKINGPVWEDSCVELFFAPDLDKPEKYFNLEINCGGTALMHYNIVPRSNFKVIDPEDIRKIEIAHSLPQIVSPEIEERVNWFVEFRIPLDILMKYAKIVQPGPGIRWNANFYKIADKTSNPHYLTWSLVDQIEPDFHLPQFFGTLIFN